MTARDVIVETLLGLDGLPEDLDVMPYSRALDGLERTTVMVRVDEVHPGRTAGTRANTIALLVIATKSDPAAAEDELDAALEDVLHVLDTSPEGTGIEWSGAKRATFDGGFPCYEISTTVHTQKEPS